MRPSFPLREGPHWHATSNGWFIVTLTRQTSMIITSPQSTFCDIMSEQERKKIQIKYSESDRKTVRDTRGLVWPQIVIDRRARYISRPGSGTHRPCLTLLGDSSTMSHSARGLINHTSCCAQGLFQPLSDHSSTPDFISYMLDSHTVGRSLLFRPCYKAHVSSSSKLGDYIGTMHLSVHLSIKFPWSFILDPGTTYLCHLLPCSGTKWTHFT
jgi:hypothetical protein